MQASKSLWPERLLQVFIELFPAYKSHEFALDEFEAAATRCCSQRIRAIAGRDTALWREMLVELWTDEKGFRRSMLRLADCFGGPDGPSRGAGVMGGGDTKKFGSHAWNRHRRR